MIIIPSKIHIMTASKVTKLIVNIESFVLNIGFSLATIFSSNNFKGRKKE